MVVLQIFKAKLLSSTNESEPDPATLMELRSATDLTLLSLPRHCRREGDLVLPDATLFLSVRAPDPVLILAGI